MSFRRLQGTPRVFQAFQEFQGHSSGFQRRSEVFQRIAKYSMPFQRCFRDFQVVPVPFWEILGAFKRFQEFLKIYRGISGKNYRDFQGCSKGRSMDFVDISGRFRSIQSVTSGSRQSQQRSKLFNGVSGGFIGALECLMGIPWVFIKFQKISRVFQGPRVFLKDFKHIQQSYNGGGQQGRSRGFQWILGASSQFNKNLFGTLLKFLEKP